MDERTSYAARSGKANGRMGWIEVKVYRERGRAYPQPLGQAPTPGTGAVLRPPKTRPSRRPTPAPPPEPYAEGAARRRSGARKRADAERGAAGGRVGPPATAPERRQGFPGTGWGARTDDPVTVVSFDPEATAAECVTLRYEYAATLRALGIPVWPEPRRDRLSERERGEWGFAKPPLR